MKKKFLRKSLKRWSDFEIISQEYPCVTIFKNCSQNLDWSINMALGNGGFLHYTDMKKFLKSVLLRNCWSDLEIILQESGFDISRRPECLIQPNCYGQAALTICELPGK